LNGEDETAANIGHRRIKWGQTLPDRKGDGAESVKHRIRREKIKACWAEFATEHWQETAQDQDEPPPSIKWRQAPRL
jgi:hypothetical protein